MLRQHNVCTDVLTTIHRTFQPYSSLARRSPYSSHRSCLSPPSMDDRESGHYDPKIHRKLHHNANPFVLLRYDGRMKQCRGCRAAFKDVRPQFVIAHQELYVYGRLKNSKRILATQRYMLHATSLRSGLHRAPPSLL